MAGLSEERAAFLREDFSRGFTEFLGFRAVSVMAGAFESAVEIQEQHRQQDGFVHAGVIATLADHTAGYSAYSLVEEDRRILTIEFKINFLSPAHGKRLVCRAKVLKAGRRVLVTESRVFDVVEGKEKQVAQALLTMAAVAGEKLVQNPEKQ